MGVKAQVSCFVRAVRSLIQGGATVSGVFLAAMMILVVGNVLARSFDRVIVGTYELVELMGAVVVSGAVAYTALKGSHVVIEIVLSRVSERVRLVLGSITTCLGIVVWTLVAGAGAIYAWQMWLQGERTPALGILVSPFRYYWAFSAAALCLVLLINLIKQFGGRTSQKVGNWIQ